MGSLFQILGVDPGASKSAFVLWDGKKILAEGIDTNETLLEDIRNSYPNPHITLAVESMISIPGGAGKSIIQTIEWADRFFQAWQGEKEKVPGHVIKKALGAKNDPGIRENLILRFGADLCHGLRGKGYHLYRAFAVCVYYMDHLNFQKRIQKG